MSGNQKQAPPVGAQTQTRFTTHYMAKPPPPPSKFTPQWKDAWPQCSPEWIYSGTDFHVPQPQQFVSQQQQQPPNQTANQGPQLRNMAPTGPPTQASTPPNADIKPNMYQQQPPPPRNATFYARQPQANANTAPRMVNQRTVANQLYSNHTPQLLAPYPMAIQSVPPCPTNYSNHRYYPFVPGNTQMMYPQQYTQSSLPQFYYGQFSQQPQPQVAPVGHSVPHGPPQTAQMPPPMAMPASVQKKPPRKGSKAIDIINPATMLPIDNDESHLTSGESSARQTPQPQPAAAANKEVQATFAKQVAQLISRDMPTAAAAVGAEAMDPAMYHAAYAASETQQLQPQPPPFQMHPASVHSGCDALKSSKIQVPKSDNNLLNTAKEPPVVSALSNAVEVTIPGKPKDRDSPAKSRKPRDASSASAKKEVVAPLKEVAPADPKEAVQAVQVVADAPLPPMSPPPPPTQEVKREEPPKEAVLPQAPEVPAKEASVAPAPMPVAARTEEKKVAATPATAPQLPQAAPTKKPDSVPVESVTSHAQSGVSQDLTAKSKQNQRSKEQKQAGSQQQAGAKAAPVQPQNAPPKPSKSNKVKEINMKGASKEGTDMDAFNMNVNTTASANAAVVESPIEVAPLSMPPPHPVGQPEPAPLPESNDSMTIKPEPPKEVTKKRVDITDIVKDAPPPFMPPPPPPLENKDETDRAQVNDKLVAAKNEVNVKTAIGKDPEIIPVHYKNSDHWSPHNQDGKRVYDREQLLALRNYPQSKQRPDNILPEILSTEDRPRMGSDMARCSMGTRPDFAPSFGGGGNFLGKSQSTRLATKRTSLTGSKSSGNTKGGKSASMIRVSISFKEDVKLHETENAWKPARLNLSVEQSDDDRKTGELYKKVRGVLNKLTPQKFDTLLCQIKTLPIDTSERLQGVIDLVFDKAVDEPNFSVAYALMCKELALMQVPVTAESKEYVNFRKLLVTRCQIEFEKNSSEENNRNGRLKDIEECTDPDKKKEIMLMLEEDDRRIRMKSVGNIRFIGELFKQQMLTTTIMVRCLHHLIENEDEERLECLCKLLTTVGKELDIKNVDIQRIFDKMRTIVERKHGKVSSRVRFMLQDVMDLRACQWVPRHTDLNPKTIDQIQKEAHNEHMTIQALNSVPSSQRKDERSMGSNADRKRGNRNIGGEDGWTTPNTRNKNNTFTVQSDKLKVQPPPTDEPLGSSAVFATWGIGSKVKSGPLAPLQSGANPYAPLEKCNDMDSRGYGRHKETYNPKGSSLERSYKQYDGRNSRSGSQHRAQENSQRITPTPAQAKPPQAQVYDDVQIAQIEKNAIEVAKEFVAECATLEDVEAVITTISPSIHEKVISWIFNSEFERSKKSRLRTGMMFTHLVKRNIIAAEQYYTALETAFASAEDLIVDIPQIWMFYAEYLLSPLTSKILPLKKLHKCAECIIRQKYGDKLLAEIIQLIVEKNGPNFWTALWLASNLSISDFMDTKAAEDFISKYKLECLIGGNVNPAYSQSNLTYCEIEEKLRKFAHSNAPSDDVYNWIEMNIGNNVTDYKFIRILTTVYIEHSIVNEKLIESEFLNCYNFLHRYISANPERELQCLFAIQSIVNQLHHPQGLLLKIFNALFEDGVITQDSFMKWKNSPDPLGQENKGVAVKQLTCFFTQMQEAESENESGSVSED